MQNQPKAVSCPVSVVYDTYVVTPRANAPPARVSQISSIAKPEPRPPMGSTLTTQKLWDNVASCRSLDPLEKGGNAVLVLRTLLDEKSLQLERGFSGCEQVDAGVFSLDLPYSAKNTSSFLKPSLSSDIVRTLVDIRQKLDKMAAAGKLGYVPIVIAVAQWSGQDTWITSLKIDNTPFGQPKSVTGNDQYKPCQPFWKWENKQLKVLGA